VESGLSLRSVIVILLMSGVAYTAGLALNFDTIITNAAQNGIVLNISPQALVLRQLSSYIGVSALCVLLSRLDALEQRSRLRAEVLTQEMETRASSKTPSAGSPADFGGDRSG
jgi:hypothetical protein